MLAEWWDPFAAHLAHERRCSPYTVRNYRQGFADLHRWHHWLDIPQTLPLAVLARPGYSLRALGGHAATRFDQEQVAGEGASGLLTRRPPAWSFIPMPLRKESSTAIRRGRRAVSERA